MLLRPATMQVDIHALSLVASQHHLRPPATLPLRCEAGGGRLAHSRAAVPPVLQLRFRPTYADLVLGMGRKLTGTIEILAVTCAAQLEVNFAVGRCRPDGRWRCNEYARRLRFPAAAFLYLTSYPQNRRTDLTVPGPVKAGQKASKPRLVDSNREWPAKTEIQMCDAKAIPFQVRGER